MKKRSAILALLLGGALMLSACGNSAASAPASSSSKPESVPASSEVVSEAVSSSEVASAVDDIAGATPNGGFVYRGRVDSVDENGSFTVSQLPGYNYGFESVVFHVSEETKRNEEDPELAQNAFVVVYYDGAMTKSIPPQATANSIKVVFPTYEGIIRNGTIQSVEKTDDGFSIVILPMDAEPVSNTSSMENLIVLNVPADALEHITEAELVEGAKVSAVTSGIATMSIPPQMPTITLLPYTEAV